MQEAAARRGFDLSALRARRLEPGDFDRFDLILGMDAENIAAIEALRPAGNRTQVRLLTDYLDDSAVDAVPDPYYTRDFDGALDLIETAIDALCDRLRPEAGV
jgi:protein-tyrosine phosphatase